MIQNSRKFEKDEVDVARYRIMLARYFSRIHSKNFMWFIHFLLSKIGVRLIHFWGYFWSRKFFPFLFFFFFIKDRKTYNRGKKLWDAVTTAANYFRNLKLGSGLRIMVYFSQRKVEKNWENILYIACLKWKLKMEDKTCRIWAGYFQKNTVF